MEIWQYNYGPARSDELCHHGIKGMKWGVRRYQNYDGSYTKRGLERYRKSEAKYDEAKARYKSARSEGNKVSAKLARSDMKTAKKEMSKNYDNLKTDKLADEGRELYKRGMTITDNNKKSAIASMITVFGGGFAADTVYNMTHDYTKSAAVAASSMATNIGYRLYLNNRNKKLRAYYAHGGN